MWPRGEKGFRKVLRWALTGADSEGSRVMLAVDESWVWELFDGMGFYQTQGKSWPHLLFPSRGTTGSLYSLSLSLLICELGAWCISQED
jgi:hypothetical protein